MDANVPDDDGATAPPPAWMTLDEIKPARAKPVPREFILQKHLKLFARDAIEAPHEFLAFDRSKKAGKFSHMRQKAQGVRKGNSDTMVRVVNVPAIWVEVKWGKNKPDDDQIEFGRRMQAVGDIWDWCNTVDGYCTILETAGVPLRRLARVYAEDHDRRVLAEIAKAEAKSTKAPKVSRGRKAEPRFLMGKRATARARAGRML